MPLKWRLCNVTLLKLVLLCYVVWYSVVFFLFCFHPRGPTLRSTGCMTGSAERHNQQHANTRSDILMIINRKLNILSCIHIERWNYSINLCCHALLFTILINILFGGSDKLLVRTLFVLILNKQRIEISVYHYPSEYFCMPNYIYILFFYSWFCSTVNFDIFSKQSGCYSF